MNMDAIKAEIREALALVEDGKQLADFWAKYFGKGGEIQKLMGGIKTVPNEEKKAYGQAVNEVKVPVQEPLLHSLPVHRLSFLRLAPV